MRVCLVKRYIEKDKYSFQEQTEMRLLEFSIHSTILDFSGSTKPNRSVSTYVSDVKKKGEVFSKETSRPLEQTRCFGWKDVRVFSVSFDLELRV